MKSLYIMLLTLAGLSASAQEKTYFLISDTHLDTQWNWDVKTTIKEYVYNTMTQNMALMDKYPNFMLNYEGAIKYMWMKEYYPTEYEKLKEYIKDGRWHVSGMSIDATDVMMSSAESILHSMLYANKFYQREFGVRGGYDIMLPDCFGFSYALPSLARHAGIRGFHTAKLGWGSAAYNTLPPFGIWQGVDGSQIYAIYKPGAYDAHEDFNKDITSESSALSKVNENLSKYGVPATIRYVGPRSDHGGGLQDKADKEGENTPYWLNYNVDKKGGAMRVRLATPDEIFDYFDAIPGKKLSVWNNELPMKTHGVGAYTSWGLLKRWNRKNELLADAAEKSSALSHWLGVSPYPSDALRDAWVRTIWQQHHDGITGTSILKANDYSYNEYYLANKTFGQQLLTSIGATARYMDTRAEGTPVVVYNPLSHDRTDIVEGSMPCAQRPYGLQVFDPQGNEVLSQITGYSDGQLQFIFAATVPSLGYAVYDVRVGEESTLTSDLTVEPDSRRISNGRYRVTINANGDVSQLYDLQNSRSLISSAIRQQFIYDHEDTWPAWEISYTDVCRTPSAYVSGNAQIELVEDGPLRKSFRIQRHSEGSTFIQYVRMSAISDRVDMVNEVDWQTHERMLKVQFPFAFSNSNDTYDISLGTISRGVRTSDHYEMQGHQWADHSNTTGRYGVSILNDCKYGWDKPAANSLRLTLLHTPSCGGYKHQANMDIGPNHFTYSLFPHDNGWGPKTQMEAAHLNQPLVAVVAPKHEGALGKSLAFASLSTDKVSIKALKKAEDSDELIVRVYEWAGEDQQDVTLRFAAPILSVREVNAIEEDVENPTSVVSTDSAFTFSIGHYQPKTFAVRLHGHDHVSSELASSVSTDTPATFTCNVDLMSYDKNRANASTMYTYAYPADLIPDTLVADGIPFVMGNRAESKYNAMRCSNSTITLNRKPGEDKFYLLMSSGAEKGSPVTVVINGDTTSFVVPYFSGNVGMPLTATNMTAQYRPDEVAFVSSHAHGVSAKTNETMCMMYMYKYCIPLPDAEEYNVVVNSSDRKAFVFAATTSGSPADDVQAITPVTTEIDYRELAGLQDTETDHRLVPKSVSASHQTGTNEAGSKANDQDVTTKWCATKSQSQTPYLQYNFASPVIINRWMVLGAACESGDYVAAAFKLQYQDANGTWIDADAVNDNQANKVVRTLSDPITTSRIRLQMVQGEQKEYTTRIYEFAVYGMTQAEADAIVDVEPAVESDPLWFDLSGRRIAAPTKPGIYINNHRKILAP